MAGRVVDVKLQVSGSGSFRSEMLGAAAATEKVGATSRAMSSDVSTGARAMSGMRDTARTAIGSFLGFGAAQGVMTAVSAGVRLLRTEVLGLDDALTQSTAIMGTITSEMRGQMETAARSMAQTFGISATTVANAFYFLGSAGLNATQSIAALPQVVAFAKAGMFDLEKATSLAVDAQTAMGLRSTDAAQNLANLTRTTDVLTDAANASNGSIEQFSEALTNKAAASGKAFGQSIEQVVGVLGAFADTGVKGRRAGEAYSILLRELTSNAQELGTVGVQVYNAQGNLKPISGIIGDIERSMHGLSVEQKVAILETAGFSDEGRKMVLQLVGTSAAIAGYTTRLEGAAGATQEVAKKQMASMVSQLAVMREKAIEFGRDGIAKLFEFAAFLRDTFGPELAKLAPAFGIAADVGAQFAAVLGGSAFMAAKVALEGIAVALGTVGGFLSDHETLVRVLATAYGVYLVAQIGRAIASFVALKATQLGSTFVTWGLAAASALESIVVNIGAARGATQTLKVAAVELGPAFAGLAAVIGISSIISGLQQAHDKVDDLLGSLKEGRDLGSASGFAAYASDVAKAYADARDAIEGGPSWFDVIKGDLQLLTPFTENTVLNAGIKAKDLQGTTNELIAEIGAQLVMLDNAANAVDTTLGGSGFAQGKFAAGFAGNIRDDMVPALAEMLDVAEQLNIPLDGTDEHIKAIVDATMQLRGGTAVTAELATEFTTLSDETASAKDQLDAFVDLMASLIGHTLNAETGNLQWRNSFRALQDSVKENGAAFNEQTAAADKNLGALTSIVAQSIQNAKTQAELTGNIEDGAKALDASRSALVAWLTPVVGSTEAASALLDQVGLTRENLETLLTSTNETGAATELDEVKAKVEAVAKEHPVTLTVEGRVKAVNEVNALRRTLDELLGVEATVTVTTKPTKPAPAPKATGTQYGKGYPTGDTYTPGAAGMILGRVFAEGGITSARPVSKWRPPSRPDGRVFARGGIVLTPGPVPAGMVASTPGVPTAVPRAGLAGGGVVLPDWPAVVSFAEGGFTGPAGPAGAPGGHGGPGAPAGTDRIIDREYSDRRHDRTLERFDRASSDRTTDRDRTSDRTHDRTTDRSTSERTSDLERWLPGMAASDRERLVERMERERLVERSSEVRSETYSDGAHVAQIAPPGAWRVWAEPETGGEAYIPLARAKRPRSTKILEAVAEKFGLTLIRMVDGGTITHRTVTHDTTVDRTTDRPTDRPAIRMDVGGIIGGVRADENLVGYYAGTRQGTASFAGARYLTMVGNRVEGKDAAEIAESQRRQNEQIHQVVMRMARIFTDVRNVAGEAAADALANSGLIGAAYEDAAQAIIRAEQDKIRAAEDAARDAEQAEKKRVADEKQQADERQRAAEEAARVVKQQADEALRREDNAYKVGATSTADYLVLLRRRLVGLEMYGDDWTRTWQQITQIETAELDKQARAVETATSTAQTLFDAVARPFASATNMIGQLGRQTDVTGATVLGFFDHMLDASKQWATVTGELASRGLNAGLLQDLLQQGPQALPLAQALLTTNIVEVNARAAELTQIGNAFGSGAVGAFQGAQPVMVTVDVGGIRVDIRGEGTTGVTADTVRAALSEAFEGVVTAVKQGVR